MDERITSELTRQIEHALAEEYDLTTLFTKIPIKGIGLHATSSYNAKNIIAHGIYPVFTGVHFYYLTRIADPETSKPPKVDHYEYAINDLFNIANQRVYEDRKPDKGKSVIVFEPNFRVVSYGGIVIEDEGKLIHGVHGLLIPKEDKVGEISLDARTSEESMCKKFTKDLLDLLSLRSNNHVFSKPQSPAQE